MFDDYIKRKYLQPYRQHVILMHPGDIQKLERDETIPSPMQRRLGNMVYSSMMVPPGQAILINKDTNMGVGFQQVQSIIHQFSETIDSAFLYGSRFSGQPFAKGYQAGKTDAFQQEMLRRLFDPKSYKNFMVYSDAMVDHIAKHGMIARTAYQYHTYQYVFGWMPRTASKIIKTVTGNLSKFFSVEEEA